jgi:lipid-binding SYLF domain-containing protein
MRFLLTIVIIAVFVIPAAAADDKIADRLWEASKVVDELVKAPDSDIPKDLLKKAECVAVIPGLKKAALGFGGQLGRGAVSCKRNGGKGAFGPPAMISVKGGSFGFQIGGQETDVVMLFMTPDSLKHLLRDKVTLGVDASAAGGPKGREASAETDAAMRSEILTYSRARGAFAGVSLKGAVLSPDKDANKSLYKKEVDVRDLVDKGTVAIPGPAQKFVQAVAQAASAK